MRCQLEHAVDHIGDEDRLVAFPHKLFARFELAPATDAVEQSNFTIVEISADGTIANGAGVAEIRRSGGREMFHASGLEAASRSAKAGFGGLAELAGTGERA
ncbi:hypothetical protein EKJ_13640 [Qipengyuania flava]|uniref:Uncharacterized protein n=1 Tax=Qipengyuania flava TaxID=192812 RepID=A0A3T1CHQ7_9SPHN|nr:hypothetical protein EKJ_13640 [Qipengyuania flava]